MNSNSSVKIGSIFDSIVSWCGHGSMNHASLNNDVNEDKGVAHDFKARCPSFSFCLQTHTNALTLQCNKKKLSLHIIQEPCVEVLLIFFSLFLRELYAKTVAKIARA